MAELGSHDPAELKRFEKKYKAIERAKWRLRQRLETIDWELDYLMPAYDAQVLKVTQYGELPTIALVEEVTDGAGGEDADSDASGS